MIIHWKNHSAQSRAFPRAYLQAANPMQINLRQIHSLCDHKAMVQVMVWLWNQ